MIFLRPWFLVLLAVPVVWHFWRRRRVGDNPWVKEIDAALLPYLWIPGKGSGSGARYGLWMGLLWALFCVALAGPAWEKEAVSAQREQPGTVIVMDLSPAMTGKYLQQARIKAADVLDLAAGEQVGLAVYDRFGYVAVPVTPDTALVREMLPALNPTILPEVAANPAVGLVQAGQMLRDAGLTDGRIMLITAGAFNPAEVAAVAKTLPYRIGVLGVGSERNGQPVALPNGGFFSNAAGEVMPIRLTAGEMNAIGVYEAAGADNRDVRRLWAATSGAIGGGTDANDTVAVWRDMGVWLMMIAVILAAVLFRRGVFFVLLIGGLAAPASAGWWLRPDQEAYRALAAGEAAYRAGDYQVAAEHFGAAGGVQGLYNQGNALAFAQDIKAAIAAYEAVLAMQPDHADAAYNKAYLEQQQEQAASENGASDQSDQSEALQGGTTSGDEAAENGGQASADSSATEGASDMAETLAGNQAESGAESDVSNRQAAGNGEVALSEPADMANGDAEVPAQIPMTMTEETADDATGAGGQQVAEEVFDQASEEILNRLPVDPGRVLRYRIYQQYQRQGGQ